MPKPNHGARAPIRATCAHDFCSYNSERDCLFSVRAGVPADDALDMASCLLDAASATVRQFDEAGIGPSAYAAEQLIVQAKALIDALAPDAAGDDPADRRFADVLERIGRLFDEGACIVNPDADALAAKDAADFLAWIGAQRQGGVQ